MRSPKRRYRQLVLSDPDQSLRKGLEGVRSLLEDKSGVRSSLSEVARWCVTAGSEKASHEKVQLVDPDAPRSILDSVALRPLTQAVSR